MNTKLAKFKHAVLFFVGISAASIPTMARADWSITGLGTLGGSQSFATAINDSGQVVGEADTASGDSHAFITGPNGAGMTDLGTLGGKDSQAFAINDSGQVVGYSGTAHGYDHAFITGLDGTGMTDLGTLGGTYSEAIAINDSGQVVGSASTASGYQHAFITGPNGTGMTILGEFTSDAFDINDSGEVVGRDVFGHAFLYSHGGMINLSLLDPVVTGGWSDIYVLDINNHGQMVGYGHHNNFPEAFLLSYTPLPIPEPETYLMLLAGLGLVGLMARRRKAASV